MERADLSFSPDEYENYIKDFDNNILENELKCLKDQLKEENDYIETNENMIKNHIDDPGFEHLIEMSISDCASRPTVINILKRKISIIESILSSRNK